MTLFASLRSLSSTGLKRHLSRSSIKMMPEGPEVSSFVYNLNSNIQLTSPRFSPIYNTTIENSSTDSNILPWNLTELQVISGRYAKNPLVGYEDLKTRLPAALHSIRSKGKFIYFTFDGFSLWSTLGLQGHWNLFPGEAAITQRSNLRLNLKFKREGDQFNLAYYDTIGYGTLKICTNQKELEEKLESLGPCWVHDPMSLQEFITLVKKTKPDRYVAVLLMDQSKTAGIGNYILAEALYKSRLFPWIRCGQLAQSEKSIELLYQSILSIVRSSYSSQIPIKSDSDRYLGEFEFSVYMRDYCPLGHPVVKELGPHKRSIHWVPNIQIDTLL